MLVIQGFLACRKHHDRIVLLVKLMMKSGLPCFKVRGGARGAGTGVGFVGVVTYSVGKGQLLQWQAAARKGRGRGHDVVASAPTSGIHGKDGRLIVWCFGHFRRVVTADPRCCGAGSVIAGMLPLWQCHRWLPTVSLLHSLPHSYVRPMSFACAGWRAGCQGTREAVPAADDRGRVRAARAGPHFRLTRCVAHAAVRLLPAPAQRHIVVPL